MPARSTALAQFTTRRKQQMGAFVSSGLARRIAAALLLAALLVWPPPNAIAGEGRIDATNGDVNFNVHFWFPPTPQQVTDVKAALDMMALGMCDATDGQMRVKRVTLSQGQ